VNFFPPWNTAHSFNAKLEIGRWKLWETVAGPDGASGIAAYYTGRYD
jgi:hypothetical protein